MGCCMLKLARDNLFCKWQEQLVEALLECIEQLTEKVQDLTNLPFTEPPELQLLRGASKSCVYTLQDLNPEFLKHNDRFKAT